MVAVLIGPFLLAEAGGWNGQRACSAELGSTLGISALGVLALVLILPTRLRALAGLGADAAVRLHRHLVGVLMALIVGHIMLAVALQPARYTLLRFVGQPWRAQAAMTSAACLLALIAVSVWRRRLRISYAAWRALHGGSPLPRSCLPRCIRSAGTGTSATAPVNSASPDWSHCRWARSRRCACGHGHGHGRPIGWIASCRRPGTARR